METLNEAIVIEVNAGSPRFAEMEDLLERALRKDASSMLLDLDKFRKLLNLEIRPVVCNKISLVDDDREDFFGACVIPDVKHLEDVIESVGADDLKGIDAFKECNIEIDAKILDIEDVTVREVMAIILHEIGHTLSDKKLYVPRAVMSDVKFSIPVALAGVLSAVGVKKMGQSNLYAAGGGLLVAAIATLYMHGVDYWRNLNVEKDADSMAIKCGYAVELSSILDKINEEFGRFSKTNRNALKDTKKMAKWGIFQMFHIHVRRASILKLLRTQLRDEKSPTAREILTKQIDALEEANKRRPGGFIGRLFESEDKELSESVRSFLQIHTAGMSELELDEIEVEIARIETTDDKLYVLQRIHKAMNIANKSKDKLRRVGSPSAELKCRELDDYMRRLKELVPRVKAVKCEINPYNIIVNYPADDYERGNR